MKKRINNSDSLENIPTGLHLYIKKKYKLFKFYNHPGIGWQLQLLGFIMIQWISK